MKLEIIEQHVAPLIAKGSPGTEGNQFGFEGGRILKIDGAYHLFTSEMVGEPMWVKMKIAHWISTDGKAFTRRSTLFESSGNYDGSDERAALWSPMPVFNKEEGLWNLFYVAYRCAPDTPVTQFRNHDGKIWRAVSEVPGVNGFGGPYRDVGIVLRPGPDSQPWEGLQGTDSFFPFEVGGNWYAFYGSAKVERLPIEFLGVGLAEAPKLAGPWRRRESGNPVLIHPYFTENPIVTKLGESLYMAVFDCGPGDSGKVKGEGTFGYSTSSDGLKWSDFTLIHLDKDKAPWQKTIRTPLGFIPEGDNTFSLYYTAMDHSGFGALGHIKLRAALD